jgi:hypothetical protein
MASSCYPLDFVASKEQKAHIALVAFTTSSEDGGI